MQQKFCDILRTPLKDVLMHAFARHGISMKDIVHASSEVVHDWGENDIRNTYALHVELKNGTTMILPYNFGLYHNYGIVGLQYSDAYSQFMQSEAAHALLEYFFGPRGMCTIAGEECSTLISALDLLSRVHEELTDFDRDAHDKDMDDDDKYGADGFVEEIRLLFAKNYQGIKDFDVHSL
jgi:hypothetical protein